MDEATFPTTPEDSFLGSQHRDDDLCPEEEDAFPWLVADAIYVAAQEGFWRGPLAALFFRLERKVPKRLRRLREWPTNFLEFYRLALQSVQYLSQLGVDVTFPHEKNTERGIDEIFIQVIRRELRPATSMPAEPDEQRPLFIAEDLDECARAAGGKRWRE
jgi:hypothetical protein